MVLHQLPGGFCKFCGNTKRPTKADVFRQTREQLAKPCACATHHFLPSFVDIFNWCLIWIEQNILHNVYCEIAARLGRHKCWYHWLCTLLLLSIMAGGGGGGGGNNVIATAAAFEGASQSKNVPWLFCSCGWDGRMAISALRWSWLQAPPFLFNGLRRGYIACFIVVGQISFILGWGPQVVTKKWWWSVVGCKSPCFTSTVVDTNSDNMMEMNWHGLVLS